MAPDLSLAIVAVAGMFGSGGVAWINGRQRRADKKQDWDRQDQVAARVKEASAQIEKIASTVSVVHTLVNSEKTEAIRRELEETKNSLMFLNEIVRLNKVAGQAEPLPQTVTEIIKKQERVAELQAIYDDRLKQATLIEQQTAVMAAQEARLGSV